MRVVVTGAAGQLGQDVVLELVRKNHEVIGTDRTKLDITNELNVLAFISEVKPDVILHCAAYTNVDAAEENEKLAYQINASGTEYLAKAAAQIGAKMLYVSTDYVFDGSASEPYEVEQQTKPIGAYGRTKLAGEELLQRNLKEFFIVRTAWVFGIHGNNFVKTMIRLGAERGEVGVVHDQVGSPTYTVDLATFMVELMETDKYGIYHATNSGVCSWYEFAVEIFKQASLKVIVNPLTSDQFPRPAARPNYSVLSKKKITEQGLTPLRDWKEALAAYLEEATDKN
ncbi:dTDP-4-dehydrorhamnose reductase [Neobacillus sp. OS1-2]|uniref:dTDP-4-dehydrorhamnose reductase n=1 Tax=Neobacillus sp. OS1-2 TaxID=3070680 RepID=UPI0027DF3B76|nr:dTDP-4-dehydrorhamnose reductase [Neobacillus sp. OS1-2]WML41203.1 dTDP-4-dehydrorhamnose reductase [Neobacillus sp. OS1-2]